jgi:molybdopterin-guanine dinucleotide biosynthesis protein A
MGRDKATLPMPGGGNFLDYAVQRVAKVCDAVAISGPHQSSVGIHEIPDPVAFTGPATGIAASLRFARAASFTACLFTPVDMPYLTNRDLLMLWEHWQLTSRLTVASCRCVQPLVGIYPVSLADALESLATSDDRSLSRWIQLQDHERVELPVSSWRNINTPDDLANAP